MGSRWTGWSMSRQSSTKDAPTRASVCVRAHNVGGATPSPLYGATIAEEPSRWAVVRKRGEPHDRVGALLRRAMNYYVVLGIAEDADEEDPERLSSVGAALPPGCWRWLLPC
jgi:hypothetical protein